MSLYLIITSIVFISLFDIVLLILMNSPRFFMREYFCDYNYIVQLWLLLLQY